MGIHSKEISKFNTWVTYYEGLGVLVKEGLIDIKLVAQTMAGSTRMFWEKIKPYAAELRARTNYPRYMSET